MLAQRPGQPQARAGNPATPNILLIMADQMAPMLTGAYGHPVVRTPNLNRLVRRGVRFDAAYSPNPVCAPARACLMTGRYSSRIGVHDNAAPLRSDEPTMAHYLTNAGYDTAWSGKMHFVGPDQHHGLKRRLSRDIYFADFTWAKSRDKKIPGQHARNYVASGIHVGRQDDRRDDAGDRHGNLALDEEAHQKAIQYLEARSGKPEEPFFLGVSYNYPHEPFWPSKELWDLYEGQPVDIPEFPANLERTYSAMDRWLNRHHGADKHDVKDPANLKVLHRAYYALVTYADRKVGELLNALERTGADKNTIVLFTSDHGDMLGHKGMVQKRSFYEWSARVPLILTMPDGQWAGRTVNEPVSLIDVMPTLLELAKIDASSALPMDGTSLTGLAAGTKAAGRAAFSESHSEGMHATCFMVRKGDFKYTHIHGHQPQLFDLSADPGEWNNLADNPEYRQVERQLRELILKEFDPARIERELRDSIARRELIKPAMKRNGQDWDFQPDPVS
ncbi:MAG: choline-sulfatase [Bryobacteraceae bacterium]